MYEITNLIMFFSLLIDQPSYLSSSFFPISLSTILLFFHPRLKTYLIVKSFTLWKFWMAF